jgi:hypothetical protein
MTLNSAPPARCYASTAYLSDQHHLSVHSYDLCLSALVRTTADKRDKGGFPHFFKFENHLSALVRGLKRTSEKTLGFLRLSACPHLSPYGGFRPTDKRTSPTRVGVSPNKSEATR